MGMYECFATAKDLLPIKDGSIRKTSEVAMLRDLLKAKGSIHVRQIDDSTSKDLIVSSSSDDGMVIHYSVAVDHGQVGEICSYYYLFVNSRNEVVEANVRLSSSIHNQEAELTIFDATRKASLLHSVAALATTGRLLSLH